MVHARAPGGALKRAAIGRKVDITVEDARRVAAEVIDRLKKGEEAFPEPPAPEPTVADLAERYVEAHLEVNCRPGDLGGARRSGLRGRARGDPRIHHHQSVRRSVQGVEHGRQGRVFVDAAAQKPRASTAAEPGHSPYTMV